MTSFVQNNLTSILKKESIPNFSIGLQNQSETETVLVQVTGKKEFGSPTNFEPQDLLNGSVFKVTEDEKVEMICSSIPKSFLYNESDSGSFKHLEIDSVEECFDGTLVRMWWNPVRKNWQLSTTRRLNAFSSFWASKKSFGTLFVETISIDNDSLDKSVDYTFVLVHPENKIVLDHAKPRVFHISSYSHTLGEEVDLEVKCVDGSVVSKPKVFDEFTTWEGVQDSVEDFTYLRGLIVKSNYTFENGEKVVLRVRVDRSLYKDTSEVRGNTKTLLERYIQIRNDPIKVKTFLEYFPNSSNEICDFEIGFMRICSYLHQSYYSVFVNKRNPVQLENIPKKYHTTLKCLHYLYKQNKQTNKNYSTTVMEVRDYISNADFDLINRLVYNN